MCFSKPHVVIIPCHSAIDRPYFFSMEGKYEAGPWVGHGVDEGIIDSYVAGSLAGQRSFPNSADH
jgi:hypothetical protein